MSFESHVLILCTALMCQTHETQARARAARKLLTLDN
jgi:hypothetical protein